MRPRRCLAAILGIAAAVVQSSGQLPMEPIRDSGQSVTGAFEGWYPNPDGSFSLLVGYFNRNAKQNLEIPVGPNNRIEPGGPDQGQPTYFLPRRQWGVFTITVPKDFAGRKRTWTLVANGQTTSIPLSLNPLWVVEPMKDAGLGNTPPVVRFEPGGVPFRGHRTGSAQRAPRKCRSRWNSACGSATMESSLPNEPPLAPALPATVSWSKFRGPGAVTFANPSPVDKDGKATTTAKFAAAGEYILRLQANDASGDGGGGFQCCWTNVHVKVTVTATAGK